MTLAGFTLQGTDDALHSPTDLFFSVLGEATLPFDSFREGFRHVTLSSYSGDPLSSAYSVQVSIAYSLAATLFVHTMKQTGHVSNQWLSHLGTAPKYTAGTPKLPSFIKMNYKAIDTLVSEFEKIQSKAFALRQKVES